MDPPFLNLTTLPNLAAVVFEETSEKLTRCMQLFVKHKEHVQIVTNEQSLKLYDTSHTVKTVYEPFDYSVQGTTFLFDDCFADNEWIHDSALHHVISYPRMLGLTSVFGFKGMQRRLPPRMCWNLDLICMGANPTTRTMIYDSFFVYLFSYDEFCDMLDTCTQGNGFLILRREGTEDRIYHSTY